MADKDKQDYGKLTGAELIERLEAGDPGAEHYLQQQAQDAVARIEPLSARIPSIANQIEPITAAQITGLDHTQLKSISEGISVNPDTLQRIGESIRINADTLKSIGESIKINPETPTIGESIKIDPDALKSIRESGIGTDKLSGAISSQQLEAITNPPPPPSVLAPRNPFEDWQRERERRSQALASLDQEVAARSEAAVQREVEMVGALTEVAGLLQAQDDRDRAGIELQHRGETRQDLMVKLTVVSVALAGLSVIAAIIIAIASS